MRQSVPVEAVALPGHASTSGFAGQEMKKTGDGSGSAADAPGTVDERVDDAVAGEGSPAPDRDRDVIRRLFETGEYPYEEKLARKPYEREKAALQVELLKVQDWVKATSGKIVILFEGRDAAGKGGPSSGSPSTSIRAARGWWRSKSRPRANGPSGSSSVMSATCRTAAKSCCSTAPGTTAPGSSG